MKVKEKIITETTFCITKAEKEALNALSEFCDNWGECSKCQFKDMCSGADLTLTGRINEFLDVVKIED